jgi:hypothetical protein
MFRQTWKKYLPVITILMKRSATGEQTLSMNHTDFERAAGGKKVKLTFTDLLLNNGRMNIKSKQAPLATDLVLLLQEDPQTNKLLQKQQFEFSMTGQFQLIIKNNTAVALPAAEPLPESETPDDKA